MKIRFGALVMFLVISGMHFQAGIGHAQPKHAWHAMNPRFYCSPAPCVLPPTQASEGGNPVTDTPIVSNPLNTKQLLHGSVDFNCSGEQSNLGFHLSIDGGSTWQHVLCMPTIKMG